MKKHFLFLAMALLASAMTFTLTACGGDDDSGSSGSGSGSSSSGRWYIPSKAISQKVNELSEGINSYGNGMLQTDFFDSYGEFEFPQFRRVETNNGIIYAYPSEWKSEGLAAIHFINDNTIEACFTPRTYQLGSSGTTGKTLLYEMDMGFVGMLGVYASYTRLYTIYSDGSGFWFSDGEEIFCEFNYANGQLYMNGGGSWVQYDPNQVHYGNVTVTAGNSNGGNNSGGNSGGSSGGNSSSPLTEISLKNWLTKVMGTLNVNPQTDSYSSILTALSNSSYEYTITQYSNSTDTYVQIYDSWGSGKYHLAYKGMAFDWFGFFPYDSGIASWFVYCFYLSQNSSTTKDQIIEDILSDFKAMGYQLYVDGRYDSYDAAYSTNPNSYYGKQFNLRVSDSSVYIEMTNY